MSRQIDLTQPLSKEDKKYLVDRGDVVSLERNAAWATGLEFGEPKVIEVDDDDQEPMKAFEDMTVSELHDVLKEKGLPVSGSKDELLARVLEASE